MSNDQLSEVRNRISAADTILLAAHLKPDGDAIGSTLALAEFLRTQNKTVSVILPDGIPELYQLYPAEYLTALPENAASYDLAILLDTAVPARAGCTANGYVPEILQEKVQIIDHHPDNPAFGRWNYLDKRAATAEVFGKICNYRAVKIQSVLTAVQCRHRLGAQFRLQFVNHTTRDVGRV